MKIINKILILFSILIGLGLKINFVSAADFNKSFSGYYWDRAGDGREWSGSFNYYYIDGVDSFCLDPDTHEGGPLSEANWNATGISDDIKERILLIAHYGYNYTEHQTLKYRAATQALIWETVTGGHTVRFFTERWAEGTELDISSERNEIERLITNHYLIPSFANKEYSVQVGQKLVLGDTNGVLSNYDVIINSDEYEINGNALTITPKDNLEISISLNKKMVYSSEYKIFVSDIYQPQIIAGTVDPANASVIINSYYGKVDITKKDSETNNAQGDATLKGATYGVYKKDTNELVTTITTDENGNASTDNILAFGDYYIKEISSSNGYQLDETRYDFEMKGIKSVHIDVKENVIKGKIKIIKQDSENKLCAAQGQATLVGAKYQVIDSKNNVVDTITIGSDCTGYSKDLPYGKYKVKEIENPKGYELDKDIYNISISTNEQVINITSNERVIKNFISILKQYDYVDGNTKFLNAEANITFEIYYPDGTKFGEITTDKNGYATIEIPYGIWKFHQVNSHTGFEKIYDFYINVNEDSEKEQYYNILNNKLSAYLQVFKIDEETGKTIAIANTAFRILNVDTNEYVSQFVGGKALDVFYTDENGKMMTYLKLEAGNYKLIEVNSPNGYLLDLDGLYFTIGEDTEYNYTTYGAVVTIYFSNSPIKGQIEVNKSGETFIIKDGTFFYKLKKLAGVEFKIYANGDILSADGKYLYYKDGELVGTIITDENGYAISKLLPLGNYYIVETKTLDGYVINAEPYYFSLTEIDNKTKFVYESYSTINYLKKGKLEFTKTDFSNSKPLPNTLIEIYTEDDELVFSGRTDENGKIIIEGLKYGRYYILEKEAPKGYKINEEKMYFEILEDGEVIKATMKDEEITGTLEFTKVDISADESLPNTLIEIYTENDELVFSGRTDENGKIIIEGLKYGKYYILEKEAPEGYQINTEKMWFEILEDGEIVKATMTNEKVIFEVPDTYSASQNIVIIIPSIFSLVGIGIILYDNKKKNKKG